VTLPNASEPCAPPTCHACGEEAEVQHQRHATQAEYDAMADSPLRPVDGVLLITVHSCGDHELPPLCTGHTPPEPADCPKCGSTPGARCTRPDGTPRRDHKSRIAAQPGLEVCRHAHREDCPGHGGCHCTTNDQPPQRIPYQPPPTIDRAEQGAALAKLHEAELAWYAKLMTEAGNDPAEAARLARAAFGEHMAAAAAGTPLAPPALPPAPIRDRP